MENWKVSILSDREVAQEAKVRTVVYKIIEFGFVINIDSTGGWGTDARVISVFLGLQSTEHNSRTLLHISYDSGLLKKFTNLSELINIARKRSLSLEKAWTLAQPLTSTPHVCFSQFAPCNHHTFSLNISFRVFSKAKSA